MGKTLSDRLHNIIEDTVAQIVEREDMFYANEDEKKLSELAGNLICALEDCSEL